MSLSPELPVTNVIQHITRRRLIVAGTTAAVGAAGIALGTDNAGAQASVNIDEGLTVEKGEFSPDDAAIFAPWLLLSGSYAWRLDADPAEWQVYLLVYDESGTNSEAVGMTSGEATARQHSGGYGLRGAITAASYWGPEDFAVPDGQDSLSVTVPVEAALVVRDAAGDMLIQAREAADAVVVVNRDGQVMGALGGTATIYGQDDSDDPTPDAPEA